MTVTDADVKANKRERDRARYHADPARNKAKSAAWKKNNFLLHRAWLLRTRYSITVEQFDALFEAQGRACAICRSTSPGRVARGGGAIQWLVDHNHNTNKVRGILCHPCNCAMGLLKDDPLLLRSAADYLERKA